MLNEQTGFINTSDGKLFYRTFGHIDSQAMPIIAVHGGPGFSHEYFTLISALAETCPIILYDQLGCGRSDRPTDDSLWSLERYVIELGRVIEHFALQRYHLLGHSFGGSIVLDYALQRPEGLQSVILSSALISVKDWLADTAARKKELPVTTQAVIEPHEANQTTDSEEYQQAIIEFNRRFLCKLQPKPLEYQQAYKNFNLNIYKLMWGPSEFACTGTLSNYERADDLAQLKLPVLLLCGERDEVRPETFAGYLQKLPKGSQLHVFEDATHSTFMESPEEYIEQVSSFIQNISKLS